MTDIEQLRKEADEIKNSLDELKNNVSLPEEEKKKKAEDLKSQAETTKQKIQSEIDALSYKTDDESKKKKEEAETLLNSFNETMNLYASILNSTESKPTETKAQEEDKSAWGKTKEWVGEQWDDVWSKEKWKTEGGKNLLRTAGFVATGVGAVALTVKGIKKLWNWAFGDDEEGESDEENKNTEKKSKKKKKSGKGSRWKKFLIGTGIATGTVVGGVEIYKNWNRISSWVKEKLGMAQSFEEAMYTVESEVRNGINNDNNFGEFSAHFEGMSYDESTQEISSFGQKTKINKSNKTIEGEDMGEVQFASREELFHAVNIVNFAKRELRGRGANESPFTVNKTTGDIDFNLSEEGKKQFIGANGSNFWTKVLGLGGAGGCGLLGGYFLGLKGGLTGVVAGGLAGYTLGSVIDNTSTMGRACSTIAKGANLQKFVNHLNKQNIWGEQKEEYRPDDETPIHKYLNKVKHEIDNGFGNGSEDSARRDLKVEWNENYPDTYKIKSYYQEITLKLEGCTAKKGEEIDFSKINNIHIDKYETISGKKIDSRGDGLDIKFPSNGEGVKEAIRTANLTNKIVNDWRGKGGEIYPFFRGKYSTPPSLDMDTDGFRGKTLLSRDGAKLTPTLFEDLRKGSDGGFGSAIGNTKSHQKEMHDQAIQDKTEGSQYIKFLHQIGEGKFWKKK